jgi:hypothetical protein
LSRVVAAILFALFLSTAALAAEPSEAFSIPLFPQKERDLKNGLPPAMTAASFWATHGLAKLTRQDDGRARIEFDFSGLIPNGIYVLETEPFKDEPLGQFGAGKHSIVADPSGRAHKVVVLAKWPGKEFLLDYHADGSFIQAKAVYPGALWGSFPQSRAASNHRTLLWVKPHDVPDATGPPTRAPGGHSPCSA